MLHVICTRLRSGHLSVRVGDGSRRSEEIVRKSRIAPFNTIIIIIIIIVIIIIINPVTLDKGKVIQNGIKE